MTMKLIILACILVIYGANGDVTFDILSTEGGDVWVGIQGNPGHPNLNAGGFVLNPGQTISVSAPDDWAGRFWARTWCDPSSNVCQTGSCGNKVECDGAGGVPPVTLVEITLKGNEGMDFYDVSLVDGFNVRASIEPVDGEGPSGQYSCTKDQCMSQINDKCPEELQVKYNGQVIACNSACSKFNTDEYCCRGAHGTAETCKSSDWEVDYPAFFKMECPDAYSYAYDDHKSTFTCKASHYRIQFGG